MIKLSQKGWNNVIIFVTLALILLFNFSSDFLNRNVDSHSAITTLIPAHAVITTIQFEQDKIERIGQGWRIQSGSLTNEELIALITHWQDAKLERYEQTTERDHSPIIVSVWLAGKAEQVIYSFSTLQDKTLVTIDQTTYQLLNLNLSQLLVEH